MTPIKTLHCCFLFMLLAAVRIASAGTQIEVMADEPGPVINKDIYGQFMEHLGHHYHDDDEHDQEELLSKHYHHYEWKHLIHAIFLWVFSQE